MKPKVAVLSYNAILPHARGMETINGTEVLFLPNSFNPKSEEAVTMSDENLELLLCHAKSIEKIIIFAGKKSSGTMKIIRLFANLFLHRRHILLFVLCPHDYDEKIALLAELGISEQQQKYFSDGLEVCQETRFLLEALDEHITSLTHVVE